MKDNKSRLWTKRSLFFATVLFGGGIIFATGFDFALGHTNTTEFCTSCHTMQTPFNELKETTHHNNYSGVRVGCADCHVPKQLGPKLWAKVMAAKDVYHQMLGTIDTPEKYEARRWHMAQAVWKKMEATDSRECRNCHSFDAMALEEQDRTARKKHEKAKEQGTTCIECHKGIAHEEPDEPKNPTH